MGIIVNDTNIFIDLHSVGLLTSLCELSHEVRTVDFVIAEIIRPEQIEAISKLVSEGKIKIGSFGSDEIDEIITEHSQAPGNISFPDCAVCYYARKLSATLLTGDRQLRRYAEANSVSVRGILFIFDEMVTQNLLSPQEAETKLRELLSKNVRLPGSEIEKLIDSWKK